MPQGIIPLLRFRLGSAMQNYFGQIDQFLSRHLTPMVKRIFLINIGVFLFLFVLQIFQARELIEKIVIYLGQYPELSLGHFFVWQFFTYIFIHVDPFHLIFNMLLLWFFASDLETRWGGKGFLTFFLATGAGAGLIEAIFTRFVTHTPHPVIGASGALLAVLLAYAAYYPNRQVLLFGIIPIQMKFLVPLLTLYDVFSMTGNPQSGVSYMTHIGGLICGYIYLTRYHRTPDIARWRYMR